MPPGVHRSKSSARGDCGRPDGRRGCCDRAAFAAARRSPGAQISNAREEASRFSVSIWRLSGDEAAFFHLVALEARSQGPNLIEKRSTGPHRGECTSVRPGLPDASQQISRTDLAPGPARTSFNREASRRAFPARLRGKTCGKWRRNRRSSLSTRQSSFHRRSRLRREAGRLSAERRAQPAKICRSAGLQPSPDFKLARSCVLPIDEAGAQRLLARLEAFGADVAILRQSARGAIGGGDAFVRPGRLDPSSLDLQLSLRRLTLYNEIV